jgi:hypothetical protein
MNYKYTKMIYFGKAKSFIIASICILVFSSYGFSQSPSDFFNAFSKQDFATIEAYLYAEMDVCIKDQTEFNTKKEAIDRLKKFVSVEGIKSVEEIHQGTSKKANGIYKVAKLTTDKGVYRLFIYSETANKVQKVKEVRIDKF